MKNINTSDYKGKPMFGIIGLLSASVLIFWPQPKSSSQPEPSPATPQRAISDSIHLLREQNNKKDSINLIEARSLLCLTNNLNSKQKRKVASAKTRYVKPEVYIRYNGEIFDAEPEHYLGFVIIDYDKFMSELEPYHTVQNEFIDTVSAPPIIPQKRSWFYRLFHK